MNIGNSFVRIFILSLLFSGCWDVRNQDGAILVEVPGRDAEHDEQHARYPVYRASVPPSWKPIYPNAGSSNVNTMLPLLSFDLGDVKIHVHNFPSESIDQRIPPPAQVERWKRQFSEIFPFTMTTKRKSRAGFVGLYFQAEGLLQGREQMMVGWAMSIDPRHYSRLVLPGTQKEKEFYKQMRADYTIKAVGKREALSKRLDEIVRFGNSFELIQEIPH